jgi:protease-4
MGRVYLPKLEPKIVDQIGGLLDAIREMKESLKNIPLVVVSDLPTYNFKNKIPLIGGIIQKLQFLSSIDEISYLSTFEIKFTNKR